MNAALVWVLVVVGAVALFALVWWTSGRAKPFRDYQHGVDVGGAEGKSRSQVTQNNASGGRSL